MPATCAAMASKSKATFKPTPGVDAVRRRQLRPCPDRRFEHLPGSDVVAGQPRRSPACLGPAAVPARLDLQPQQRLRRAGRHGRPQLLRRRRRQGQPHRRQHQRDPRAGARRAMPWSIRRSPTASAGSKSAPSSTTCSTRNITNPTSRRRRSDVLRPGPAGIRSRHHGRQAPLRRPHPVPVLGPWRTSHDRRDAARPAAGTDRRADRPLRGPLPLGRGDAPRAWARAKPISRRCRPTRWCSRRAPTRSSRWSRRAARPAVPVIAFGAGTSVEGNTLAVNGGVALNLSRMTRIVAVNAERLRLRGRGRGTARGIERASARPGPVLPDRSGRQCHHRRHGLDPRIGHQCGALRHDARGGAQR